MCILNRRLRGKRKGETDENENDITDAHERQYVWLQYSYVKCCDNLRRALRHDGYGFISCCVILWFVNCRFFFSIGAIQPIVGLYFAALCRAIASSRTRFLDHTQRRATVGRTPLNEWSVCRRDLYLTTHSTHNRQTSMSPVEFEPTISAGERP
jgi:hypothetical protein